MNQQLIKKFVPCTIIYVFVLASTFCALWFIFDFFNLFYTNIDNERYLLSAMAQSQAAIIAIVITVSLVAVQLAASAYSPRVINIFKSNLDFWILLTLYGASILYDFILLKTLSEKISKVWIFIAYWLCSSTFLALVLYVIKVMKILTPEVIIKRLAENICVFTIKSKLDPFQPIVDIVCGAFMKYDYETVRIGLENMQIKVIEVIELFNPEEYKIVSNEQNSHEQNLLRDFSRHYFAYLEQIGKLLAERKEELTLKVIENLEKFVKTITEKRLKIEYYGVKALKEIGETCVQSEFMKGTKASIRAIKNIEKNIPNGYGYVRIISE